MTISARTGRDSETGELVCPITAELPIRVNGLLRGVDHYAFQSWAAVGEWLQSDEFPTSVESVTFTSRIGQLFPNWESEP